MANGKKKNKDLFRDKMSVLHIGEANKKTTRGENVCDALRAGSAGCWV